MIGVFDSGAGGITAIKEVRRLSNAADIAFFPDRPHAPYGTKSPEELIPLVERDVELLLSVGADTVLMACCTASTVHPFLRSDLRRAAIPIIEPTAKAAARVTKNGRIAVLATDATVRARAFGECLSRLGNLEVSEFAARELVASVEGGARDGRLSKEDGIILDGYVKAVLESGADTLILGCTHFPHLEGEIQKRLPRVKIISSSREGAIEIEKRSPLRGKGKTVYIGEKRITENTEKKGITKWENTEEAGSTTP